MRRLLLASFLAIAGCSSASPSAGDDVALARPPTRPATAASAGETRWLVVDHFFLGATDASAWKRFGYDLDGRATARGGASACKRREGSPSYVLEDGEGGIDNNVGHLVIGMIKGLMADVETETNTRIASGRYTIVLRLDNVGPSDNARVPGALWLVGERAAPRFAPDEKWPVAGKTMFPLQLFPSGYMRNGVWVSTDSDSARASIPVPVLGDALVFPLRRAVLSVGVDGSNGIIAGVVPVDQLQQVLAPSLVRRGMCVSDATHRQFMSTLALGADMRTEPSDDEGECDALSVGIGFTMKPIAGLDGVTGEPPPVSLECSL